MQSVCLLNVFIVFNRRSHLLQGGWISMKCLLNLFGSTNLFSLQVLFYTETTYWAVASLTIYKKDLTKAPSSKSLSTASYPCILSFHLSDPSTSHRMPFWLPPTTQSKSYIYPLSTTAAYLKHPLFIGFRLEGLRGPNTPGRFDPISLLSCLTHQPSTKTLSFSLYRTRSLRT